jgi:hypothetical protein
VRVLAFGVCVCVCVGGGGGTACSCAGAAWAKSGLSSATTAATNGSASVRVTATPHALTIAAASPYLPREAATL